MLNTTSAADGPVSKKKISYFSRGPAALVATAVAGYLSQKGLIVEKLTTFCDLNVALSINRRWSSGFNTYPLMTLC